MDKYELNLKLEQVKQLAEKKLYNEVSKIAGDIPWRKVKDWPALEAAMTAYEQVGNLEEARDMAILAYNRNFGGKRLVYKLTEMMIELKQFDDAERLYDEYEMFKY